jgi:hypothetical protein
LSLFRTAITTLGKRHLTERLVSRECEDRVVRELRHLMTQILTLVCTYKCLRDAQNRKKAQQCHRKQALKCQDMQAWVRNVQPEPSKPQSHAGGQLAAPAHSTGPCPLYEHVHDPLCIESCSEPTTGSDVDSEGSAASEDGVSDVCIWCPIDYGKEQLLGCHLHPLRHMQDYDTIPEFQLTDEGDTCVQCDLTEEEAQSS